MYFYNDTGMYCASELIFRVFSLLLLQGKEATAKLNEKLSDLHTRVSFHPPIIIYYSPIYERFWVVKSGVNLTVCPKEREGRMRVALYWVYTSTTSASDMSNTSTPPQARKLQCCQPMRRELCHKTRREKYLYQIPHTFPHTLGQYLSIWGGMALYTVYTNTECNILI